METSLEPEESFYFNRHEYRFTLKDDKGLFRSNKTLMCKYIILAESKEKADECLKRESILPLRRQLKIFPTIVIFLVMLFIPQIVGNPVYYIMMRAQ